MGIFFVWFGTFRIYKGVKADKSFRAYKQIGRENPRF